MSLRIADIRSPELFQRLVRLLFSAERGKQFQVVDDSSGDRGNDGYDREAGELFAIYCPEKGMRPNNVRAKAKDDLAKAVKLRQDPGYQFDSWYFVTPEPLPEALQATLRAEAEAAGLRATFLSAENLEPIYLAHPHLHDLFPELTYPNVSAKLNEIEKKIDLLAREDLSEDSVETNSLAGNAKGETSSPGYYTGLFVGFVSDELATLQEAVFNGDERARFELERYRLQATSIRERLVALMIECEYEQEQQNFEVEARLASEGFKLAQSTGANAEAAVFGARLAFATTMSLVPREVEFISSLLMSLRAGIPLISEEEANRFDREVPLIRSEINQRFKEAYRLAQEGRNLLALFTTALLFANAQTQSVFPLWLPGRERITSDIPQRIKHARETVHHAYDLAINIAAALNNKRLTAMAFSNYANDIRFFGETTRAREHATYALQLARELGDKIQVAKSEMLLERLKSNPDGSTES